MVIWWLSFFLTTALDTAAVTTESTPLAIRALLASTRFLQWVPWSNGEEEPWPEVVLDYSYNREVSRRLVLGASESVVLCMYEDCPRGLNRVRTGADVTASRLAIYLHTLNSKLFLAVTASPFYQQVAAFLISQELLTFAQVVYLRKGLSEVEVEQFVGRVLKPAGSPVAVLLVDEDTGKLLYSALQRYDLYKKGYAYFFSAEAVWTTRPEGALFVTEAAAAKATSQLQFETLLLDYVLIALQEGATLSQPLSLINIHQGSSVVLTSLSTVNLPGNVSSFPSLSKPVIEVSADFQGLNSDGSVYPSGTIITTGIVIAYEEANRRPDLLSTYQYITHPVALGAQYFNKTWALSQLNTLRPLLGIVHHPFGFTSSVMGLNDLFTSLNMFVPMTTITTGSALSDPVRFPMYLRMRSGGKAMAVAMLRFIQLFRWSNVAIIYSDEPSQVAFYTTLRSLCQENRINITNNETLREVPINLDAAQRQLNFTLLDLLHSPTRILIIAHSLNYLIAERLYDLGARAGDYLVMLNYGLTYTLYAGSDPVSVKRRQVFKGAMMVTDFYFGGAEGPRVRDLLVRAVGVSDPLGCLHYDNVMLGVHAVQFMLARGLHFEQGRELVRVMRKTRFNGCIGVNQIEEGSNDRLAGDYSILSAQLVGENETLKLVDVALYSPARAQLFTLFPTLQFPDGSVMSFPDTWATSALCPYLVKDIHSSSTGTTLTLVTCWVYVAMITILAFVVWRAYWREQLPVLDSPQMMGVEDSLLLLSTLLEWVQMLALGPQSEWPLLLARAEAVMLLRLEQVRMESGVYWTVEIVILCWCSVYCLMCVLRWLGWNVRLRGSSLYRSWEYWWELLLPSIGNCLFLPAIVTLLSVFDCHQAALADSFLHRDCHVTCWQSSHLIYLSLSSVFLGIYTPLALWSRPLWQQLQPDLHVKYQPLGLLIHTVFLSVFAAAQISLQSLSPTLHSIVYSSVAAVYLAVLMITKPFNYERANLWRRLLVAGVVVNGVIETVVTPMYTSQVAFIVCVCSYAVLLSIGVIVQQLVLKYRSLLIRVKEDRYDIIKFAFTFGQLAERHLQCFKSKLTRNKYSVHSEQPLEVPVALSRVPVQRRQEDSLEAVDFELHI